MIKTIMQVAGTIGNHLSKPDLELELSIMIRL